MTKLRSGRRTATSGGGGAGAASKGAAKKKQSAKKKRSADDFEEDSKILKKAKPSINKAAEELVCPILQGLPIDPVIAEDGQIYERKEIEKYLKEKEDEDEILSPVTKQPFETKALVSSVHTRNVIEHLIGSGIIEGEIADTWKERMSEKKRMERLVKRTKELAEGGDGDAMYSLGVWYEEGYFDLEEDDAEAYRWYKKSADAGNVMGIAAVGFSLLIGLGVEKDQTEGLIMTASAAANGSKFACYHLGRIYYFGVSGSKVNYAKAKFWLEKAIAEDCDDEHLDDLDIKSARRWIARCNRLMDT